MPLNTGAFTPPARVGNNPALSTALAANSGIYELAEEAPLYPAYLTGAVATGTSGGLTARGRAGTMTPGTYLGACYIQFLFTAQGSLLKGDENLTAQVIAMLGRLASSRTGTTKKGFKDVAKAAKATNIKSLKAPPEEALGSIMPEAVI
jgi:hypothetical protein